MLASLYDKDNATVGVFWGHVRYGIEKVEDDEHLEVRTQLPTDILYSQIKAHLARPVTVYGGARGATGGIAATAKLRPAVHFMTIGDRPNYMMSVERDNGVWAPAARDRLHEPARMIAAVEAQNGNAIITGFRTYDAQPGKRRTELSGIPVIEPFVFKTGDMVILVASNSKYLSRVERRGAFIEASKDQVDDHCIFRIERFDDGRIALRADGGKHRYLSRVASRNLIAPDKDAPDAESRFSVVQNPTGKIALRASNGRYWRTLDAASHYQIHARGGPEDAESWFTVRRV
jgi:hypothetical protein